MKEIKKKKTDEWSERRSALKVMKIQKDILQNRYNKENVLGQNLIESIYSRQKEKFWLLIYLI